MLETLMGGAISAANSITNNLMAGRRESAARQGNYQYNEMAAENADRRTRKLYQDFQSPEALLRQYKEAGLSPSLMFGGGGIGGQTTQGAQGAGAGGINPTIYGVDPLAGAQIAKTLAEVENIKQDTKKKGAETDLTFAQIDKTVKESESQRLKNDWQAMDNICKSWETAIAQGKNEYEFKTIMKRYDILCDEARSAKVRAEIDEKTESDVINYATQKVRNLTADTILKKCQGHEIFANIQMNVAQMEKMLADIVTQFGTLDLERDKLNAQVEQWAKQNGFTKKEQNIEIAKTVADVILELRKQNQDSFGDLLKLFSIVTVK